LPNESGAEVLNKTTSARVHQLATGRENRPQSCIRAGTIYLCGMNLTEVQDQAIQARMALIVGAKTFDRLFASIRFAEADGSLLYAYAKDEETAAEIEDNFALHISIVASQILQQEIDVLVVLPKVLQ
jgi:hypothetical protein